MEVYEGEITHKLEGFDAEAFLLSRRWIFHLYCIIDRAPGVVRLDYKVDWNIRQIITSSPESIKWRKSEEIKELDAMKATEMAKRGLLEHFVSDQRILRGNDETKISLNEWQ